MPSSRAARQARPTRYSSMPSISARSAGSRWKDVSREIDSGTSRSWIAAVSRPRQRPESMGPGEIGRDRRRHVAAGGEDLLREAAIDLRVPFEDDRRGTEPLRLRERHPRAQPEAPRLVRARGDHARAHDDGLALEPRIALLL